MRVAAAVLALIAALALAACGSDDDDKEGGATATEETATVEEGAGGGTAADEQEVRAVVEEHYTTSDYDRQCELRAEAYHEGRNSSLEECKTNLNDLKPEPGEKVTFTSVEINGDEAVAEISLEGGVVNNQSGTVELKKEDGEWKLASDEGLDFNE